MNKVLVVMVCKWVGLKGTVGHSKEVGLKGTVGHCKEVGLLDPLSLQMLSDATLNIV